MLLKIYLIISNLDEFGETDTKPFSQPTLFRYPFMQHRDDNNGDDAGDTSGEGIPMQVMALTMNRPPERGLHTAETSFIEGEPEIQPAYG